MAHANDLPHKLEEKLVFSDQSFRGGRVTLDVFWSGEAVRPEIHRACMRGDYLNIWPDLPEPEREKLRRTLVRKLLRKGGATLISIDIASDCEAEAREIFAKHHAEIIDYIEDGPGGGNPNFKLKIADIEAARALVREVYDDAGMPDDEIDELYLLARNG